MRKKIKIAVVAYPGGAWAAYGDSDSCESERVEKARMTYEPGNTPLAIYHVEAELDVPEYTVQATSVTR